MGKPEHGWMPGAVYYEDPVNGVQKATYVGDGVSLWFPWPFVALHPMLVQGDQGNTYALTPGRDGYLLTKPVAVGEKLHLSAQYVGEDEGDDGNV